MTTSPTNRRESQRMDDRGSAGSFRRIQNLLLLSDA